MHIELDIMLILDRSGSMETGRTDHEGGIRSFVADQKKLDGKVFFTFVQFDTFDHCEVIFDRVDIQDVKESEITLIPRGGTPLLDAIGQSVAHLQKYKPEHVIVMIVTDGEENSSHEWTKEKIRSLITDLDKKGWNFLFLGANVDAFHEGGMLGMKSAGTMTVAASGAGVGQTYASTSGNIGMMRYYLASASAGSASLGYEDWKDSSILLTYSEAQKAASAQDGMSFFVDAKAGTSGEKLEKTEKEKV